MFKAVTSIIFVLALAVQTFKGEVIILDYYTNTTAFARNCVNKARPKLHCNGKCQMIKKLQEEEKKNEQVPERRLENDVTVCVKSFFTEGTELPVKLLSDLQMFYNPKGNSSNYNVEIFHPPQLLWHGQC